VQQGGLDIADRDQPLVEMLKCRLNPRAASVDDALETVSIEAFLNTFFGTITPFVAMMQDLLTHFETAGATEGPEVWTLALGEGDDRLEVNLDHFRKWIERGTKTVQQRRKVPILNCNGLWALSKHFRLIEGDVTDPQDLVWRSQPQPSVISPDLQAWLTAYQEGIYRPLPHVVEDIYEQNDAVADVAAVLMEIYGAITAVAPTRQALEERGRSNPDLPSSDFWGAQSLRNFESDFWVKGRVLDLAAWHDAPADRQRAVTESLIKQLQDLPKRVGRLKVTIQDIDEILSLPIWKRRYELYSAWVLTSILHALAGHSVELHHDHGVIAFSFRETLMASILSSDPPLRIFAEKRTVAQNLVGHGRASGVQPDYSLWSDSGRCPLAIECKHYKRSSTRNFADALNDYSAALPQATVILVNYGPVSPAVGKAISESRSDRCKALGTVHPEDPQGRAAFEKLVYQVVGAPVPPPFCPDTPLATLSGHPALLVDISGSMRATLDHAQTRPFIETLIRTNDVRTIVAADDQARLETGVSPEEIAAAIAATGSGRTALSQPVQALLERFTSVIVLTDRDGAGDISGVSPLQQEKLPLGGADVFLVTLTRPSRS
jgi:hypothetical protein